MARTNTPEEDAAALNRRKNRPEGQDARAMRREAEAEAAGRNDVPPARLGAEVVGEPRATENSKTADAIKRAAESDTRV